MESVVEAAPLRPPPATGGSDGRKADARAGRALLLLFEDDLFSISRSLPEGVYPLALAFPSLAASDRILSIFGRSFARRLRTGKIRVEIADRKTRYMRVSERDGRVFIDRNYLLRGDPRSLLLDLIHELVHVRQFIRGRDLYDDYLDYVDRPVELEAFTLSLKEARGLGMSDPEMRDYLRLEWVTEVQHLRLLEHLGMVPETAPTPCHARGLADRRAPATAGKDRAWPPDPGRSSMSRMDPCVHAHPSERSARGGGPGGAAASAPTQGRIADELGPGC